MIKLLDILLESIKESKPIKFDNEIHLGIKQVYGHFQKLPKDLSIEDVKQNPIILGHIKINARHKYNAEDMIVRVVLGYLDDENTNGQYLPNKRTITLNFKSNEIKTKEGFMNTLYHELIHAIDPKISNYDLLKKTKDAINSKEKKDASDSYIKYLKRPEEFDAFSSSFVNQLEDTLKSLPEDSKNKLKSSIKNFVNILLGIQKKYPNSNIEDKSIIVTDIKNTLKKTGTEDDIDNINDLGFDSDGDTTKAFLYNIIYYLNKPSLFKKYVQRLATLL